MPNSLMISFELEHHNSLLSATLPHSFCEELRDSLPVSDCNIPLCRGLSTQVYEGEVIELTPEETENPLGGYSKTGLFQREWRGC